VRELGRGGNQEALNCDIISRLRISLPSKDEQKKIVAHLDTELKALEKALISTQDEIDLVWEYRTRLVADVVTGKLDVSAAAAKLPDLAPEAEPLDESEELLQDESAAEDFEVAEAA
jgi:type I restriction enzyme S subunit